MLNRTKFWRICTGRSCQIYSSLLAYRTPPRCSLNSVNTSKCHTEHLWPGGRTGNYWLSWKNESPSTFFNVYLMLQAVYELQLYILWGDWPYAQSQLYDRKIAVCIQWRWIYVAAQQRQQGSCHGLCLYPSNVSALTPHPPHPADQRSERWYEPFL